MARKNAKGSGTIRKTTVTRSGREYAYREAWITTGRYPGTGKQIQRSFMGKTQKEVREKMQAAAVAVNEGTYTAPQRVTVGQWLDIWQRDYLGGVKPSAIRSYRANIRLHINPALGAVKLSDLHPHIVQGFINGIDRQQNPVKRCTLPRREQQEIHPLTDGEVTALLDAAKGGPLEQLIIAALFTGMRLSELLGLTCDCINFDKGTITVNKRLAHQAQRSAGELHVHKEQ